jgi:hypothetical protein
MRCYSSLVAVALLVAGCSAGDGSASPSGSAASPAQTSSHSPPGSSPGAGDPGPSIPAEGASLAVLGFSNGPSAYFSVPRTVVVTDRVDQPSSVTLVLASPTAAELESYFRRVLPAAGFTIEREDRASTTLTFSGHGWRGAFTGTDSVSAVFLRPG